MKKSIFTRLLALAVSVPAPAMAGVNIGIGISLPLPIVFASPPDVIVIPETDNVYVVPDIDAELFFWNGWWWRPWDGNWYRSQYHDSGWSYYNSVPRFYFDVDPGWRTYYRSGNWSGHRWDHQRISNRHLKQNWKGWNQSKHWEKRKSWGVQNYRPRPQQQRQVLRNQRQEHYRQKPEVQQQQQRRHEQQRAAVPHQRPAVQQHQQQRQEQHQPEARQPSRQQ